MYKEKYEEIKNRTQDPVSKGTVDTHFYTIRQFGLIKQYKNIKAQYIITNIGKKICELLEKGFLKEYKDKLYIILITNEEKSDIFNNFYNHLIPETFFPHPFFSPPDEIEEPECYLQTGIPDSCRYHFEINGLIRGDYQMYPHASERLLVQKEMY